MTFKKYKIKEQIFTTAPRYIITNEHDELVAEVRKHYFSWHKKASYFDEMGEKLFIITRKAFTLRSTYFIEKDGKQLFRIFKTFGFKANIYVESLSEPDAFMIQGNFWHSEYAFYKNGIEFAYVSRDIWKLIDNYGVAIKEEEDHDLVLAMVIVIDLIRDSRKRKS